MKEKHLKGYKEYVIKRRNLQLLHPNIVKVYELRNNKEEQSRIINILK